MARGKLPFHVNNVPYNLFTPFNDLYRVLGEVNRDLELVEGKTLPVNESKASDIVLAASGTLQFRVEANKRYRFRSRLVTNGNFKYRLIGPAAPTLIQFSRTHIDAGVMGGTTESAFMTVDGTLTNPGSAVLEGILHNGPNAGTVAIQWAQNASNVTPTLLYGGSFVQYSPVA